MFAKGKVGWGELLERDLISSNSNLDVLLVLRRLIMHFWRGINLKLAVISDDLLGRLLQFAVKVN